MGTMSPTRFELSMSVDAGTVVVEIVDDGVGYGASDFPEPDADNILDDEALVAEPGFFLLYEVMDSVEFRRDDGYNVVTLRKEIADDGGQEG